MTQLALKDLRTVARRILDGQAPHYTPVKYYSRLFEDYYIKAPGGSVMFDSGVRYTADELEKLKGVDKETLKGVHNVKLVFENSTIIQ